MSRRRTPAAPRLPEDLVEAELEAIELGDDVHLDGLALRGALPPGARARSATIGECRLGGSLAGSRLPTLHLHDCELAYADLANVDVRGGALHRVALRDCRLTGAQLGETSIRDATFTDCRLDLAALAEAKLERVVFSGCVLRDATLEAARLRDVRFERCDLSGASLGQVRLERVELAGCTLAELRSITDLRGAAMPWPDLVEHAGQLAAALGITVLGEG